MSGPTVIAAEGFPTWLILVLAECLRRPRIFSNLAFGFSKGPVILHKDGRLAVAEMGFAGRGRLLADGCKFRVRCKISAHRESLAYRGRHSNPLRRRGRSGPPRGGSRGHPAVTTQDYFWGARNCLLRDPYGNVWVFGKLERRISPPGRGDLIFTCPRRVILPELEKAISW